MEFLSEKGNVIHGDISINNILINRVWEYSVEDSPSRLRALASGVKTSTTLPEGTPLVDNAHDQDTLVFIEADDHNDKNDDNSMPKLGLGSPHGQPGSSSSIVKGVPILPLAPAPAPVEAGYNGTLEHIEAAGMLIDCDFMRYKDVGSHQTSVRVSRMFS